MTVKPHIFYLWLFAFTALFVYGIASLILSYPVDNRENNAPPAVQHVPRDTAVTIDQTLPTVYFFDEKGEKTAVTGFSGQVVLVNLWATWCLPCVAELPALDRLQKKLDGAKFRVVAISLDRQTEPAKLSAFFEKHKIENLSPYWDKNRDIPSAWDYDGLPTSFLLRADGTVARIFRGPAEWDRGEAFDAISALVK